MQELHNSCRNKDNLPLRFILSNDIIERGSEEINISSRSISLGFSNVIETSIQSASNIKDQLLNAQLNTLIIPNYENEVNLYQNYITSASTNKVNVPLLTGSQTPPFGINRNIQCPLQVSIAQLKTPLVISQTSSTVSTHSVKYLTASVKSKLINQLQPCNSNKHTHSSMSNSFETEDFSQIEPGVRVSSFRTFSNLTPKEIVDEKMIDGKSYYQILWTGTTWDEKTELLSSSKTKSLLTQYLETKRDFESSSKENMGQNPAFLTSIEKLPDNHTSITALDEVESSLILNESNKCFTMTDLDKSNSCSESFKMSSLRADCSVDIFFQQPISSKNEKLHKKTVTDINIVKCKKNLYSQRKKSTSINTLKKVSSPQSSSLLTKSFDNPHTVQVTQINQKVNSVTQTMNPNTITCSQSYLNYVPVQVVLLNKLCKENGSHAAVLKDSHHESSLGTNHAAKLTTNFEEITRLDTKTKIQCQHCSMFYNSQQYALHNHLSLKRLCPICNLRICNKKKLIKHIINHEKTNHICSHCFKLFSKKKDFMFHAQSHTNQVKKSKKICKGFFSLRRHTRKYSGNTEVLYKCIICRKQFSSEFFLEKHTALHKALIFDHKESLVLCPEENINSCNQNTLAKKRRFNAIFMHRFTNKSKLKKSVCITCIIGFKNPESFYKHINSNECVMIKNSGHCVCCKQTFNSLDMLRTHMTTCFKDSLVSLLKPFNKTTNKIESSTQNSRHAVYHCSKCNKFLLSPHISCTHNKVFHLKRGLFCSRCPFKCYNRCLMSKHVEKCVKSFKCFVCDESSVLSPEFSSQSLLINHLKTHKKQVKLQKPLKPATINDSVGQTVTISLSSSDIKKLLPETFGLCEIPGFGKYVLKIVESELGLELIAKRVVEADTSTNQPKSNLKCFSCLSEHQSHLILEHFKSIHNWNTNCFYPCKNCNLVFQNEIGLNNHNIDHGKCILDQNQNLLMNQKDIENSNQTKKNLIATEQSKNPAVIVCLHCDLPFFTEQRFRNHKCTETNRVSKLVQIDWACLICKKKIDQSIQAHCATHSAAIFECFFCNLKVLSKFKLVKHFKEQHKKTWGSKMEHWVNEIQNDADEVVLDKIYHKKLLPSDKLESDFKCQSCLLVFFHAETLKNHMLHVCKDKSINKWKGVSLNDRNCPECHKCFNNESSFLHHCLQSHGVVFKLRCSICSKLCMNTKEILKHISNDHNLTDVLWVSDYFEKAETVAHFRGTNCCTCCLGIFNDNLSLLQHMFIHIEVKTEVCNACGKLFVTLEELKIHVYTFHKCFFCECCRRMLHSFDDLYFHSQLHVLELNIPRDENGKIIVEVQEDSRSDNFHKLFPDETIDQPLFSITPKVKRDILEDDRLFNCYVCRKNVEGELTFIVHIKMHPIPRVLFCLLCNGKFDNSSDLETHLKSHFDKNMNFCEDFIKVNTSLEEDKDDFFKCKICYEVFGTEEELVNHTSSKKFNDIKMKLLKKAINTSSVTKRYYDTKNDTSEKGKENFFPYIDWQLADLYNLRKIFDWKFGKIGLPTCKNLSIDFKKTKNCEEKNNFLNKSVAITSIDLTTNSSLSDIRAHSNDFDSEEVEDITNKINIKSNKVLNKNANDKKNSSNNKTYENVSTERSNQNRVSQSNSSIKINENENVAMNSLDAQKNKEKVEDLAKEIHKSKPIKESCKRKRFARKDSYRDMCSNVYVKKSSKVVGNKQENGKISNSTKLNKKQLCSDGEPQQESLEDKRERNLRVVLILADGSNNVCKFCSWKFPSFEELKSHLLKHIDHPSGILIDYQSRDVCCALCSSLVRKTSLMMHLKLKHSRVVDQYGQFKCKTVKAETDSENNKVTQINKDLLNSGKKDAEIINTLLKNKSKNFFNQPIVMPYPYTCAVCNRGYFQLSSYLSHYRTSHPWLYENELNKYPKVNKKKQIKTEKSILENDVVQSVKIIETVSKANYIEELPHFDIQSDKSATSNDHHLDIKSSTSNNHLDMKSDKSPTSNNHLDMKSDKSPTSNNHLDMKSDKSSTSNNHLDMKSDKSPTSNNHLDMKSDKSSTSNNHLDMKSDKSPTSNNHLDMKSDKSSTSNNQLDMKSDTSILSISNQKSNKISFCKIDSDSEIEEVTDEEIVESSSEGESNNFTSSNILSSQNKETKCALCQLNFLSELELTHHMKTHKGRNIVCPYLCLFCGFASNETLTLKDHLLTKHKSLYTKDLELSSSFINRDFKSKNPKTLEQITSSKLDIIENNSCISSENEEKRSSGRKRSINPNVENFLKGRKKRKVTPEKSNIADLMKTIRDVKLPILSNRLLSLHNDNANNVKAATEFVHLKTAHCNTDERKEAKYPCKWCGVLLASQPQLDLHKKNHRKGFSKKKEYFNKLRCCVCSSLIPHYDLKWHMHVAHDEDSSIKLENKKKFCKLCKYSTRHSLDEHTAKEHPHALRVECKLCDQRFPTTTMYEKHFQKIHGNSIDEKGLICYLCNKTFETLINLHNHYSVTHMEKNSDLCCKTCNKFFYTQLDLIKHQSEYHNCDKFECGLCMLEFNDVELCVSHVIVHKKLTEFKCSTCNFYFDSNDVLKKHILNSHESVSNHHENCGKVKCVNTDIFMTKMQVNTEDAEKSDVIEQIINKCVKCDETFIRREIFLAHMEKFHPL
ncbi:uncharacterized protein LOC101240955 isoform X3 [Hydra vulgaris]|uniref:Uncharacterized protein LOC101240955 isoform X3 n=1 Tax=Hydra vulgaris TaxID=6087 RepID=A0ABM4CHJ8_HYDVU